MAWNKIMIIVAQSTYTGIEVGLHNGISLNVKTVILDKKEACAQLIPKLHASLQQEGVTLDAITKIIVNKGPAPFSSLRTVIATMNGIAYASHIPLFGISVFDALNYRYNPEGDKALLIVLRAYSKEYYYGFYKQDQEPVIGICSSDELPSVSLTTDTRIIGYPEALSDKLQCTTQIIPLNYCRLSELAQYGLHVIDQGLSGSNHISHFISKTIFNVK